MISSSTQVFPKDFAEMIHWLKPDMLQILTQTTVPQTRKKMETTLVKNRILEEDCQAQAKKAVITVDLFRKAVA